MIDITVSVLGQIEMKSVILSATNCVSRTPCRLLRPGRESHSGKIIATGIYNVLHFNLLSNIKVKQAL